MALLLSLTLASLSSMANPKTPDIASFTTSVNDSLRAVAFANTSIWGSEPGERIAVWNFGDGNMATTPGLASVSHVYAHPGTYSACLRIYRRNLAGDTVLSAQTCQSVVINQICNANFEKLQTPNGPINFAYFKAFPWSNGNPRPYQVCWNFGDGHDTCINYATNYTGLFQVGHQYANAGNYQVCVIIRYDGACTATNCKVITIGNPPPPDTCGADFEKIQTNANPFNTYFKALPSHNNNRKPSRVCWRFGDGRDTCIDYAETYTGFYAVNHLYNHPDNYEVCVRITYYGGCESYKCKLVRISGPDSCGANFEKLQSPAAMPLQVFLKAQPSHNNNRKPSRICWNFGDGHDTCINYVENYTGQYLVSHRYAHPDSFNVCVRIQYYGGCVAEKCHRILVPREPGCAVSLVTINPSVYTLERGFIATPISYATPPARPLYICWRFGDGRDTCYAVDSTRPAGTNFAIRHRYDSVGVYNACVRVVFQGGCIAESCKEVRILPAPPRAGLRLAPNPVQQVLYVSFQSIYTEAVVVRIVNSNGIPVRTYTRNANAGVNNWSEVVSNLAPGIYTYVVQSPRQFVTEHFIKL